MQMRILPSLIAIPLLAGCATFPGTHSRDPANSRIGEAVYVDGPIVKPIAVIEDSRCPKSAQCVWAGRVRVKMLWMRGDGPREFILSTEGPTPIADGVMTLTAVRPERPKDGKINANDYRFGLAFAGGI